MPALGLNIGLPDDTGKDAGGPSPDAGSKYLQPDGVSYYLRPDGTSFYLRP